MVKVKSKIRSHEGFKQYYINLRPDFVLDLGCGEGAFTQHFANVFHTSFVLGIDLCKEALKLAKDYFGLDVIQADALHLPIKSKITDFLICHQVIEHVQSDRILLQEIRRVLKNIGSFYITSIIKKKIVLDVDKVSDLHTPHVRSYQSLGQLTDMLRCEGFHVKTAFTFKHAFPLFDLVCRILYRLLKYFDSPPLYLDQIVIATTPPFMRIVRLPIIGYNISCIFATLDADQECVCRSARARAKTSSQNRL